MPDARFVSISVPVPDDSRISICATASSISIAWRADGQTLLAGYTDNIIQHVLTEANDVKCRCGFLKTDSELTVFQFARELVGPGIASARSPRKPSTIASCRPCLSWPARPKPCPSPCGRTRG
jgi:hypothetical protein